MKTFDLKIFNALPGCYLLLDPQPGFIIVAATDLYLSVAGKGNEIIGKSLFEVFPGNPEELPGMGEEYLKNSLKKVVESGRTHKMPVVRYDVRKPGGGEYIPRYWKPLNIPILNDDGGVKYILHSVEEVTDEVKLNGRMKYNQQHMQLQLANAVTSAQELERGEISRELHDNINQILITAKMFLGRALDKTPMDEGMAAKGLELIDNAVLEIKKLSNALLHTTAEEEELVRSLEALLKQVMTYGSINVVKKIEVPDESLIGSKAKLAVLRIVQEQLANIMQHADARNLYISMGFEDHLLSLTIKDDGKGFSLSEKKSGMGFLNMKSRVALLDGNVSIESAPGDGCTISVNIPLAVDRVN